MVLRSSNVLLTNAKSTMGKHLNLFFICIIIAPLLLCGCSHFNEGSRIKKTFKEANNFFSHGDYQASLSKYQQIIKKYPTSRDRVLFEMGIIYAYPGNEQKNYQNSLECFQKLIKDYPGSGYRKDSEMMIFNINNVIVKDQTIATQQVQIEALRQEVQGRGDEIITLQKKIEALEQELKSKDNEVLI